MKKGSKQSKESINKLKISLRNQFKSGRRVWNKGLTKDTDSRIITPQGAWKKGNIPHNTGKSKDNYAPLMKVSKKNSGKNNPACRKEVAAKISASNKGKIPHNKGKTKLNCKYLEKQSQTILKQFANGRRLPPKSKRGNGGYREDLGHYVRSNWEANYARICKLLNKNYEFEKKRFTFYKDNGNIITTYTPDFTHKRYVELKGYVDEDDRLKLKLFQQQYPEEYKKLIIIDFNRYKKLEKYFKSKINNWE